METCQIFRKMIMLENGQRFGAGCILGGSCYGKKCRIRRLELSTYEKGYDNPKNGKRKMENNKSIQFDKNR